MRPIRIGTRASALARVQTVEVVGRWRARSPRLEVRVVELTTDGDDLPLAPLERMEGTGFFTSTLERALIEGTIDVAVHSLKDLPVELTPELILAAIPERGPAEDVLCARAGARLSSLPPGARVGTSSLRRIAQLRALREDFQAVPLRGNVPTRLERLARGELDAVVLARAGLARLGLSDRITETLSLERMLPAPGQGALAVQVRAGDSELLEDLAALDHLATRRAVEAERAVLHALRGGCSVPVAAHASAEPGNIVLEAGVFALSGRRPLRARCVGDDPVATGEAAARALIGSGALEILAEFHREPRLAGRATS